MIAQFEASDRAIRFVLAEAPMEFRSKGTRITNCQEEVQRYFDERGWTDGLPIVPPTEERVEKFLTASGASGASVLGRVPPSGSYATAESIAINAVMAGCRPEYTQVIHAAVRAMCREEFGLGSLQVTTHPVAPLVIVNGPVRHHVGINCGAGLFGPGFQANATIGRALRLILINVGGARPGAIDKSTQGQPSKYSFCIGENEEASPWSSLAEERGMEGGGDAVTLFAGENPHNVNDHRSSTGEELLTTFAASIAISGCNNVTAGGQILVVFGPEHAETLSKSGFNKDDVRSFLFERAEIDPDRVARPNLEAARRNDRDQVRVVDAPEDILVMVAGGSGRHSLWLPCFGRVSESVTEPVLESFAVSCAC